MHAQDTPSPNAVRPDTTERPGEGVWANYDFVPGHRVLYFEDFSEGFVGDVPRSIGFENGTMEIVEWQGGRYLRTQGDAQFTIPLGEPLPERFTLETALHLPKNATVVILTEDTEDGWSLGQFRAYYEGSYVQAEPGTGETGVMANQVEAGEAYLESTGEALREGFVPVRIMADGAYVKMYLGAERIANVPNAQLERTEQLEVRVSAASDEHAYFDALRVAEGGRVRIYDALQADGRVTTKGILFSTGSAAIRPESTPTLQDIARTLKQHPDLRLGIEGHTDAVGAESENQALSQRRAEAVKQYLVDEHGVDPARLEATGKGESEPVASNDTPAGRQSNRRVELVRMQEAPTSTAQEGNTRLTRAASPQEASAVSPDQLAALLPAKVSGGFTRTDLQSGMRKGQPGAQATYEGDAGALDITIGTVDAQTRTTLDEMPGMQANREEALTSIQHRGHAGYRGPMQGRRQIVVFVGEQGMVRVGTDDDLPMDQLRAALEAVDFNQLEAVLGASGDG